MKIVITDDCQKEIRRLSKKYISIVNDFRNLLDTLQQNPFQGDALGKNCYKVRMAITSKGVGKSYGARVITCVKIINDTIYILSVYDKSNKKDISDQELDFLLKETGLK
jgi:mRNA-degrading endonuclease RelE of RelBE toxin-antitoxin system